MEVFLYISSAPPTPQNLYLELSVRTLMCSFYNIFKYLPVFSKPKLFIYSDIQFYPFNIKRQAKSKWLNLFMSLIWRGPPWNQTFYEYLHCTSSLWNILYTYTCITNPQIRYLTILFIYFLWLNIYTIIQSHNFRSETEHRVFTLFLLQLFIFHT